MAKVLPWVEQVVVDDPDSLSRWVGFANDEVPDWVLAVTSSPRAFDIETPPASTASLFPGTFPATF